MIGLPNAAVVAAVAAEAQLVAGGVHGRTAAAVAAAAHLVASGVHDAAWHRYGTALSVVRVAHYLRRAIYNNNNNGAGTGLLVVGYCHASVHRC